MATKPLIDITIPDIGNTYTFIQGDNSLSVAGKAADAKKTGDEIANLKEALTDVSTTLTHKADVDGTVASAEQLLSDVGTEDKQPYLFRATPYDSTRVDEELVGCSVGWNQLMSFASSVIPSARDGITFASVDGTACKMTGTATATVNAAGWFGMSISSAIIINHVYFVSTRKVSGSQTVDNGVYFEGGGFGHAIGESMIAKSNGANPSLRVTNGNVLTDFIWTGNCIDLTAWFGSAIADYAYTLEQATAGSGVAWIKALLPSGYIPYSAPKMESVSGLSAHVMRDADENIIGNYPLDSDLTLRGILKMDSDHRVYADGDVYLGEGKKNERYAEVDLGERNWNYNSTDAVFWASFAAQKRPGGLFCARYPQDHSSNVSLVADKSIWNEKYAFSSDNLVIKDSSYTDAATFKAAMSGVKLVYEKATPTTETADPYASPQNCAVGGTEEYVYAEGGSGIPVGHNSKYLKNMRSELERVSDAVPVAPSVAGTYSLKATVTAQGVTYAWVAE